MCTHCPAHETFPFWKTAYNLVLGTASLVVGALVALSVGPTHLYPYLGALLLGAGLTVGTVCPRCSNFGRRCGLGAGLLIPLVRPRGRVEEFCRTWPQHLAIALLAVAGVVGMISAVRLSMTGAWGLPVLYAVATVAFVLPHPRWMCGHCLQRAQGRCPVGGWFGPAKRAP